MWNLLALVLDLLGLGVPVRLAPPAGHDCQTLDGTSHLEGHVWLQNPFWGLQYGES